MQRECKCCGCLAFQIRMVYCEDCNAHHEACQTCAEDVAAGCEGYQVVA
jgi:hypothetical protein